MGNDRQSLKESIQAAKTRMMKAHKDLEHSATSRVNKLVDALKARTLKKLTSFGYKNIRFEFSGVLHIDSKGIGYCVEVGEGAVYPSYSCLWKHIQILPLSQKEWRFLDEIEKCREFIDEAQCALLCSGPDPTPAYTETPWPSDMGC